MDYIVFFILLLFTIILFLIDTYKNSQNSGVVQSEWSKTESPIERRLLNTLNNNGYIVTTQVPVGKYRIDIAFEYHKLAIECDGKDNHSSVNDMARDRRKDKYLRSCGWKVRRFTGRQIHRNMNWILKEIDKELVKLQEK